MSPMSTRKRSSRETVPRVKRRTISTQTGYNCGDESSKFQRQLMSHMKAQRSQLSRVMKILNRVTGNAVPPTPPRRRPPLGASNLELSTTIDLDQTVCVPVPPTPPPPPRPASNPELSTTIDLDQTVCAPEQQLPFDQENDIGENAELVVPLPRPITPPPLLTPVSPVRVNVGNFPPLLTPVSPLRINVSSSSVTMIVSAKDLDFSYMKKLRFRKEFEFPCIACHVNFTTNDMLQHHLKTQHEMIFQ